MLVCALTVPIDDFDDTTPLPAWLRGGPARTRWALQAVLALADAEPGSQRRRRYRRAQDDHRTPTQAMRLTRANRPGHVANMHAT